MFFDCFCSLTQTPAEKTLQSKFPYAIINSNDPRQILQAKTELPPRLFTAIDCKGGEGRSSRRSHRRKYETHRRSTLYRVYQLPAPPA